MPAYVDPSGYFTSVLTGDLGFSGRILNTSCWVSTSCNGKIREITLDAVTVNNLGVQLDGYERE